METYVHYMYGILVHNPELQKMRGSHILNNGFFLPRYLFGTYQAFGVNRADMLPLNIKTSNNMRTPLSFLIRIPINA